MHDQITWCRQKRRKEIQGPNSSSAKLWLGHGSAQLVSSSAPAGVADRVRREDGATPVETHPDGVSQRESRMTGPAWLQECPPLSVSPRACPLPCGCGGGAGAQTQAGPERTGADKPFSVHVGLRCRITSGVTAARTTSAWVSSTCPLLLTPPPTTQPRRQGAPSLPGP